jgi:hypothetical protein
MRSLRLLFVVSFAALVCAWSSIPAFADTITATEIRGLRYSSPELMPPQFFLLEFSAVKALTEDRTVAHFDLRTLTGPGAYAYLSFGIYNLDPGGSVGTLDFYWFYGDGTVSVDEWDAGTFFAQVVVPDSPSIIDVALGGLVDQAWSDRASFLSFRMSTTSLDRFDLIPIFGDTRGSGSSCFQCVPDVVSLTTVPEPTTLLLTMSGLSGLLLARRRFATKCR